MKRWMLLITFVLLFTAACTTNGDETAVPTLVLPTSISSSGGDNNPPPPTVNDPTTTTTTAVPSDASEPTPTLVPTPTETATPTPLAAPPTPSADSRQDQPALSHDLLFIADGNLQRRDSLSGNSNLLLAAEGTQGVTDFSLTADGERLVAARLLDADQHTYELMRVDVRNVLTWKLADAPHLRHFSVSPDGRYALYVAGGRPFAPLGMIATAEAESPDQPVNAGTVYRVDMENQQSQAVGECVDISAVQDIAPEFVVGCQAVLWTRDSQNMLWADYEGLWLRHLAATEPTLFLPNDMSEGGPNFYYRPLSFARNGRHLLLQQINPASIQYLVFDLVTQERLYLPDSTPTDTNYVNVNWMQDDRLFNLRRTNTGTVLELWRIGEDNRLQLEETTAVNLPAHQIVQDVVHSSNGRFNFVVQASNPSDSGLYVMASSNEQPVKATALPYETVTAVWAPDGSGATLTHPYPDALPFYGAANEQQLYALQPHLGLAHTFQWRPKQ